MLGVVLRPAASRRRAVSSMALLHRRRDLVGVHDDAAVHVARRAADRLDERARAAQEALLVGVEDRDERHLGQVEPLAQQVDADEHVELAEAQVAQDVDALERVDVGVQVADADAELAVVLGEVLGHALGQRRARARARSSRSASRISPSRSSTCPATGPHLDLGIDQARRADDLLDDDALRLAAARTRPASPRRRCAWLHVRLELLELERPVVERARQAEAVLDQRLLARAVAAVHRPDLRDGLVRLVDDDEEVLREVVDERRRRLARLPAREVARVVLDAVQKPICSIISRSYMRPLLEALLLEEAPLLVVEVEPLAQLLADARRSRGASAACGVT